MLLYFLTDNFMSLIILIGLIVIIAVNRDTEIPGARYFHIAIILLLISIIAESAAMWAGGQTPVPFPASDIERIARIRTWANTVNYVIRPFVVMTGVLIVSPRAGKKKFLIAIPAMLNAAVYLTALFGSHAAFWVSLTNIYYRGPLGFAIYYTVLFYVFLLALFSIIYYRTENVKRSAIVFLIVVQAVLAAILEGSGRVHGIISPVMALGMLEYYFYLSVIYQHEMRETIAEHKLRLERQRMTMLRNQIQPHFIFNSLAVIRSLAKRDSGKAVSAIDSFSDYLKAHIYFIQDDELISFEKELGHVKAYLDLVRADAAKEVDVIYDLEVTDFNIPPLTLEPIVENAIKHGIDRAGGQIRIETRREDGNVVIRVADSGKKEALPADASGGMTEKESKRLGVGIANTRTRLQMQCHGSLDTQLGKDGSVVTITIPESI